MVFKYFLHLHTVCLDLRMRCILKIMGNKPCVLSVEQKRQVHRTRKVSHTQPMTLSNKFPSGKQCGLIGDDKNRLSDDLASFKTLGPTCVLMFMRVFVCWVNMRLNG